MIRYTLTCRTGHGFDSWFPNATAFDDLKAAGHLSCPVCGTTEVDKSLMAPAVVAKRPTGTRASDSAGTPSLQEPPQSDIEAAIAALRKHVEENSEYVGMNFAVEARRMHDGDAPARAIYGEARPEEAKKLVEDGLPVAPLPFLPSAKRN
jgi:hypothetical protein